MSRRTQSQSGTEQSHAQVFPEIRGAVARRRSHAGDERPLSEDTTQSRPGAAHDLTGLAISSGGYTGFCLSALMHDGRDGERRVVKLVISLAVAILLIGCTPQDAAKAEADRASTVVGNAGSCLHAGPLACPVEPLTDPSPRAACDQLRACLAGRAAGDAATIELIGCEPPASPVPAPTGTGAVLAVETMAVESESDGPPDHAVYLLVQDDRGWCPAAELLGPVWQHGGHCETSIDLQWAAAATELGTSLTVRAERLCHMPLDQSEFEAGESDVVEHACVEARYVVVENGLDERTRATTEGTCPEVREQPPGS